VAASLVAVGVVVVVGVAVGVAVEVAVAVAVAVGVGVAVVVAVEGRAKMIDINAIKARLARVAGKWPTTGVLAPGADEFGPKAFSAHGPLRCHATETGSARQWTQANADADFIAAAPADIDGLVAEVELLRTSREVTRDYADRVEAEVLALRGERAAVVAWLREQREYGTDALLGQGFANVCNILSNEIERGSHRREEKP
jgi:hypothetical protein